MSRPWFELVRVAAVQLASLTYPLTILQVQEMVPVDAVAAPQSASLTCVLYTAGSRRWCPWTRCYM